MQQGKWGSFVLLSILALEFGGPAVALADTPAGEHLRASVHEIFATQHSVQAVEALVSLGPDAEPVLLEALYEHPDEALAALHQLATSRSTIPLLDYLVWAADQCPSESPSEIGAAEYLQRAGTHCTQGIGSALRVLERLADPRSIEPLMSLSSDPSISQRRHKIGIAEALLAFDEPDALREGSEMLVRAMNDATVERRLRWEAAVALAKKGQPPVASRAREWILTVAEMSDASGERARFLGEDPNDDGWYQGFESDVIDALAELGTAEAKSLLRSFLAEGDLMVYDGRRIVEILLKDPEADDEAAVLAWIERLLGEKYNEPLLAIQTLDRLSQADPIHDGRRFAALVEEVRKTPADVLGEPFQSMLERLYQNSRELNRQLFARTFIPLAGGRESRAH